MSRAWTLWLLCPWSVAVLVGCGGPTLVGDDYLPPDAGDATTTDARDGGDAATSDAALDGTYACGSAVCQPGELCFKPCSGGISVCEPAVDDAGACPPGTHTSIMCSVQGSAGPCEPDPPPPYCGAGPCSTGLFWAQSGRDCIQLCQ